jgi:hypothetical protein
MFMEVMKHQQQTRSKQRHSRRTAHEQPKPVTTGITRAMVRQHAFELYRDKLPGSRLTLEDWVLAEKDLVQELEADGLQR